MTQVDLTSLESATGELAELRWERCVVNLAERRSRRGDGPKEEG